MLLKSKDLKTAESADLAQRDQMAGAESVRRALQLLSGLALPGPPKSLLQLAAATELPKSTAYRLLRVLEEESYIQRSEGGGYHFGRRFFSIALSVIPELELYSVVKPLLQEVADATGETVTVHRRIGTQSVLIFGVESNEHLLRYVARMGDVLPVVRSCSGRAMLAFFRPPDIDALLKHELPAKERPAAKRLLKDIRGKGFFLTDCMHYPGLNAIAVPVLERGATEPIFSLLVSGPSSRWTKNKMEAYSSNLIAAAKRLSLLLAGKSAV